GLDIEQGSALPYGAMEESLSSRRNHIGGGAGGAGRLTAQRDIVGITAKRGNVVSHPAQRRLLIQEALNAEGNALRIPRRMGEIAEQSETVVDGDDNRRAASIRIGMKKERQNPKAEIEGKQALFVVNLEPRKMAGELSEGMLFDIGYADKVVPVLALP